MAYERYVIRRYSENERPNELQHHGILGMHWGIRRYQPYPSDYSGDGKFVGKRSNADGGFGQSLKRKANYMKTYAKHMPEARKYIKQLDENTIKDYKAVEKKRLAAEQYADRYAKSKDEWKDIVANAPTPQSFMRDRGDDYISKTGGSDALKEYMKKHRKELRQYSRVLNSALQTKDYRNPSLGLSDDIKSLHEEYDNLQKMFAEAWKADMPWRL